MKKRGCEERWRGGWLARLGIVEAVQGDCHLFGELKLLNMKGVGNFLYEDDMLHGV